MQPLIQLKNVSAGYPGKVILRNIDFTVNTEDFIGVIGPNGGGKTTLLKLILGIIKPFEGQILYRGQEPSLNFNIGYQPQQIRFDSRFPVTVLDVVLSGIHRKKRLFFVSRQERSRALHLLDWVGLSGSALAHISELSGGQMQKVFLCRALISDPVLLILDEPDTFVDNTFEGELFIRLRELNRKIAIILVSHDLGMISSWVKTIACVNETLHHHHSNVISRELLQAYKCPIDLITHGALPHRVLNNHKDNE